MRAVAALVGWKGFPSPRRGDAEMPSVPQLPSPLSFFAARAPVPLSPPCSPRHICSAACAGTSDILPSLILKAPHALKGLLKGWAVFKGWMGHSGGLSGTWAVTNTENGYRGV